LKVLVLLEGLQNLGQDQIGIASQPGQAGDGERKVRLPR